MSSQLTQVATEVSGVSATSRATAAFTPNASRRLFCITRFLTNGNTISSVTGHGTWTQVASAGLGSGQIVVHSCVTSASPSSSAVTVNHSSAASLVTVFEASAAYSGAIIQSNTATAYLASANQFLVVNLSAFANTSNLCVYVGGIDGSTATITNESPLTTDWDYATGAYRSRMASFEAENTTPSVQYSPSFRNAFAIAFEVAAVSGGSQTPHFYFRRYVSVYT